MAKHQAAFDEWCPLKIVDAAKAPKSAALVAAYERAWNGACDYLSAQEELGESLADAVLATHDNPGGADCACMVCKLAREFKKGCNSK